MSDQIRIFGLSNEFTPDSAGWVRLAPWGEHPKTRTVRDVRGVRTERWVQVLGRGDGETLVRRAGGLWGRLKRSFQSVPVYAGHPDLAQVSPETGKSDETPVPVGGISRLEAREDGLYVQVGLFPDGRTAVENEGLKYLSALWWVERIDPPAGAPNGTQYGKPIDLISVGLTDSPNIQGGDALANQGPPQGVTASAGTGAKSARTDGPIQEDPESKMKSLLIGLLVGQGVALANDASDDAVLKSANELLAKLRTDVTALGNEKTSLTSRVTALEGDLTAEKSAHSTTKTALETSKTALANERAIAAPAIVDLAITQGRIPIAEREARITRVKGATDLAAETTALANEAVKHPVGAGATSGDRREDSAATTADEAERKLTAIANESIKSGQAADWSTAWMATKQTHPALHETLAKKA
jgi:hypothetical protein